MKVGCLAIVGLIAGAVVGGAIGVGAGLIWVQVFQTSSFEGYSGMLVFYAFMPIGTIVGGLIGAISLGIVASRASGATEEH